MHYFRLLFFLFMSSFRILSAQEVISDLLYNPLLFRQVKQQDQRSLGEQEAINLPFIEDFSQMSVSPSYERWIDKQAFINSSFQYFPVSVGVATLDALDEYGMLYPQAGQTPFSADTLTSRKIRLDTLFSQEFGLEENLKGKKILPSDSLYLSFYVQPGGGSGELWARIGNAPNSQDSIFLEFFRGATQQWEVVWASGGLTIDSLIQKTGMPFFFQMIPIVDTGYFNDQFQFRFRNIASLSSSEPLSWNSNADQWNIDYVYLDARRRLLLLDTTLLDLTFVQPANSVLKNYEAMPSRQFQVSELKTNFENLIANLHASQTTLLYHYIITNEQGQTLYLYDGGSENISPFFPDRRYHQAAPQTHPPINYNFSDVQAGKESVYYIKHIIKPGIAPSDFITQNDTITFKQVFSDYYAYDDGTPENGYGVLTQYTPPKIAYKYGLTKEDTLVAVSLFFNPTLDQSNFVEFKISVWDELDSMPNQLIYQDGTYRNPEFVSKNHPVKYILEKELLIKGNVFIGIEQKTKGYINLGYDRNRNAEDFLYYFSDEGWNTTFFQGAVMIRPYFGESGKVGIASRNKEKNLSCTIFPNPTNGNFFIKVPDECRADRIHIRVWNLKGEEVFSSPYKEQFALDKCEGGIYVVRVEDQKNGVFYTTKLILSKVKR